MARNDTDEGRERRSAGRRWRLVGLVGLGVSVIGVVSALLAIQGEATTTRAEPVAATSGPGEATPTLLRIRANVEARVEEDGVVLGTIRAPDGFVLDLPRSDVLRTWVVKAEGYADQTVQVRPIMGTVTIDVELQRADGAAPDAAR